MFNWRFESQILRNVAPLHLLIVFFPNFQSQPAQHHPQHIFQFSIPYVMHFIFPFYSAVALLMTNSRNKHYLHLLRKRAQLRPFPIVLFFDSFISMCAHLKQHWRTFIFLGSVLMGRSFYRKPNGPEIEVRESSERRWRNSAINRMLKLAIAVSTFVPLQSELKSLETPLTAVTTTLKRIVVQAHSVHSEWPFSKSDVM